MDNKVEGPADNLGTLWQRAVQDYSETTNRSVEPMRAQSMREVMKVTDASMERFGGARHKGDKVDKVRSAFGSHLEDIQKCFNGIKMVGTAASVFPPAMPVEIVFAACGHLLNAFAAVKAEYDKVENFFNTMSRFFQRLCILEQQASDSEPLMVAIVRIFSTHLSICGMIERKMVDKGRFKQWLHALWDLEDQEFAAAYKDMNTYIEELGATVLYAGFSATKAVQKNVASMDQKLDGKMDQLDGNVQLMHASTFRLETSFEQLSAQVRKAVGVGKNSSDPQDRKKQGGEPSAKGDVPEKKFRALRTIASFFEDRGKLFPDWKSAHKENIAQRDHMRESFVQQTAGWLTSDPDFGTWVDGRSPLLWIRGPDGIGKSFLAYATAHALLSRDQGPVDVAYFYSKEDSPPLQSIPNALACMILQIAESNSKYAERVASRLKEGADISLDESLWKVFFASMFPGGSPNPTNSSGHEKTLYLVFDGLDEFPEEQRQIFVQFLASLKNDKARVSVLVTGRAGGASSMAELAPHIIEATKERMEPDIKALIRHRLASLPRLKEFSHAVKRTILRKVSKQADGMLYVEHMMRRLSDIGREGAVLKGLSNLPESLEDLYRLLLEECRRDRSEDQYQSLKKLFAWLAFSKRPLGLAAASELMRLTLSQGTLDVEDEIIRRSSRILELSRTRRLDEDIREEALDEDADGQEEEKEPDLKEYHNAAVIFHERSLRQYFRTADETTEKKGLRTPASTAHLKILAMCGDVLTKTAESYNRGPAAELSSYAVSYWYEHLDELNVEHASGEEISQVLQILRRITSNNNNVARVFEYYAGLWDLYPERSSEAAKPWYDNVLLWVHKGLSVPDALLDTETKEWVRELGSHPMDMLLPLARGHVDNWLDAEQDWQVTEAYRFAQAALELSGHPVKNEEDPLQEILSVAGFFEIQKRDPKAMKAIGVALFAAASALPDDDRRRHIQDEAVSYLEASLGSMDCATRERITTLRILAVKHSQREAYTSAVDTLDKALQLLIEIEAQTYTCEKQEKLKSERLGMYILKAHYYKKSKQVDAALKTYNEARGLCGKETLTGNNLDDITMLYDKGTDPDGHHLMDTLKSWTTKERNTWFNFTFDYWRGDEATDRMSRAAKLCGEVDLLLEWLTAFEKTLSPRSIAKSQLTTTLADIYYRVIGEVDKAKDAMHRALKFKPNDPYGTTVDERMSSIRMDLAELIFAQFQASADPQRKASLLAELKALPSLHTDDDLTDSYIGMLVANMLRVMGPAVEYQKYMDQIFKTCIGGLEDNVSWNDGTSLRLLAKVVGSLDGLERDAGIAISAQFSILDRKVYGVEAGVEPPTSDNDEAEDLATQSEGRSSIDDEESTEDSATTLKPPSPAQYHLNEEDLADWNLYCDVCARTLQCWSEPIYYCLLCPNTDLCESCHGKRIAQNTGEELGGWRSFCNRDHVYIKGPMKGWRGVKNGVIRIEGEEGVRVGDWVQGLKERWVRAWGDWWVSGVPGVRDIGV